MHIDVSLNLSRDTSTIAMARHISSCALREVGASPRTVADVELALSEACANVIEHATNGDEYEVRLDLDEHQCRICIVDHGPGIDADDVTGAMPAGEVESGRGIALMRVLVDHIDFNPATDPGTAVFMVKTLDGADDIIDLRHPNAVS